MKITTKQLKKIRNCGGDATMDELGDIIEIWTPEEIKAYIYNVGTEYGSLNTDIEADRKSFSPQLLSAWDKAYDSFIKFVLAYDESNWFAKRSMSPVRAAERFQDILEGFREQFVSVLGKAPSMKKIQKKPKEENTFFPFSASDITKYAVIAVVIGGAIYFVTKK